MSRLEVDEELHRATARIGRSVWGFAWRDGVRLLVEHDPNADSGVSA